MDITEFLLARIAEDEAEAHAAINERSRVTPNAGTSTDLLCWPDSPVPAVLVGPERVLKECAAKRAIIDAADHGYLSYVAPLAAVYSDHPDYQEKWSL